MDEERHRLLPSQVNVLFRLPLLNFLLQNDFDGNGDNGSHHHWGLKLHNLSINQERFGEIVSSWLHLADKFVSGQVPILFDCYFVLASELPYFHIEHHIVKHGGHLVLVANGKSDLFFLVQDLLPRVIWLQEMVFDIREAQWLYFGIFRSNKQRYVAC